MEKINKIYVSLFFLSFCFSANSQITLDEDFYRYWLLEKYYDGLMARKTPAMFGYENISVTEICLPKDSSIIFISNFYEGMILKYIPITRTEILIPDSIGFTKKMSLNLIEEKERNILQIIDSGKIYNYFSLPNKYSSLDGLQKYLRDIFFTGRYYLNNSHNNIVTFNTDGKMDGIQKFNRFDVIVTAMESPINTNIVVLREYSVGKYFYKIFKWENEGTNIILYEVNEDNKIGKKIYTLTKID